LISETISAAAADPGADKVSPLPKTTEHPKPRCAVALRLEKHEFGIWVGAIVKLVAAGDTGLPFEIL
jgi:hypothetical protein